MDQPSLELSEHRLVREDAARRGAALTRSADGTDSAAAPPCRHLAAVSTTADVAVAPTTAATVKNAKPVKMMRL